MIKYNWNIFSRRRNNELADFNKRSETIVVLIIYTLKFVNISKSVNIRGSDFIKYWDTCMYKVRKFKLTELLSPVSSACSLTSLPNSVKNWKFEIKPPKKQIRKQNKKQQQSVLHPKGC